MQKIFYFALFLLLTVTACKKDNPVTNEVEALETTEETPAINNEVYEIMKQWYLWNQELPEVDLASYSNPNDLMKALAWHPNDRWSYVGQASTYSSFYDEGQFVGHGFGSTWYEDGIRILNFVYEDSPAYRAGLRRGFTIESVNGTPISNINSFSSSL